MPAGGAAAGGGSRSPGEPPPAEVVAGLAAAPDRQAQAIAPRPRAGRDAEAHERRAGLQAVSLRGHLLATAQEYRADGGSRVDPQAHGDDPLPAVPGDLESEHARAEAGGARLLLLRSAPRRGAALEVRRDRGHRSDGEAASRRGAAP